MGNLFLLVVMMSIMTFSYAESAGFATTVAQTRDFAKIHQQDAYKNAKNFKPENTFAQYSSHPPETSYYEGVTQTDMSKMNGDALTSMNNSDSGKTVSASIKQRPQYVINPNEEDIQHSMLLQSEADHIVHGVTDQYIDCKPKTACTTQYQQKQCEEAPQTIFQSCKKVLNVDVIPHETITHYPLIAHLSVSDHNYAGVSMNAVDGHVDFLGPNDAQFHLDGRLPGNVDCHTLQGSIVSTKGNAHLDYINFPSCSNGLAVDFHISNGHVLDLQIDMVSTIVTYDTEDRWVDDCSALISDLTCKLKSEQCDIPKSTKTIQGISITRDCWQESFNYICRGGNGGGNCEPLQSQGCEQIGSQCSNKQNEQCTLYQQTYQCPIQSCSLTTDVVCGNGDEYCLDGSCTDHSYKTSQDFAKGVSALSAVADAAKQLDQSALLIFTGHPVECSEKPVGYSNCCKETGWGQNIGLDHCPDAAKQLHIARQNKLAIAVGRYCSGSDPFPCIEHSQVFCVFSSKLAKIIEEQGRVGQLHIGFGSAKEPNCKGITADQLQAIDLSKINFQDFITDLDQNVKIPDIKQTQDSIEQHIEQYQQSGQLNA